MELQVSPVNEETVFSKLKKKRIQKLNGPDSPLYKVIWPFIYIARVFGFAPYNFSQDRIMPSNINLIFTMIATIFYSYALYEVCVKFTNIKRDIPVLGQLEDVKVLINYSVVMYEVGLMMFTRNSFVRIWAALQDYDESVRQLGYSRKETWTAIVAWFFVIVTTVIWIVINRSGMYAFMESWFHNVRYMLPYLGTLVSVYKFVAVVMFLGQRFRHLNAIALQNLPPVTGRGTVTVSKKTILSLHNDLMIAAENLGSLYSLSLLLWLGNLTLHTINSMYFIIKWILINNWDRVTWPLTFCLSNWLFGFLLQLVLLHIACDFTSSQANCMGSILIEWQVRMIKNEDCIELLLQFLNRRLQFSAGGCFYVNLPLLRSIASMMTTYLVILLQLQ